MSMTDLESEVNRETIIDKLGWFVLRERDFGKYGDTLREFVEDEFRSDFLAEISALETVPSLPKETIDSLKSLEESFRKERTIEGLDVICRKGGLQDLRLVRKLIRNGKVKLTNDHLRFFGVNGEWEDIALIIEARERNTSNFGRGLLIGDETISDSITAKAIYNIGQERLDEILSMEIPSDLISYILSVMSVKKFTLLKEDSILRLLQDKADKVRELVAVRTVACFTMTRLTRIFDSYLSSGGGYYYNVVHIFDFGISLPRGRTVAAAKRAFAEGITPLS